ncbi:MAG: hypothetical protein RL153_868 [Verrucomicrobiota bacterium]
MLSKRPASSQPPNPEKTGPVEMGCSRCEDVIHPARPDRFGWIGPAKCKPGGLRARRV